MFKSFLHSVLFLSILFFYSLSAMFINRGANTARFASNRVRVNQYNPAFQSQKRLSTSSQQNPESWSSWASRLWYGGSPESDYAKENVRTKENSNSRPYSSYVPYTQQYELENKWEQMTRAINTSDIIPTQREIEELYEVGTSLGYDILNRTNAQGYSLLAILVSNLYKHRYELERVKQLKGTFDQLFSYGVRLDAVGRNKLEGLPVAVIETLKRDLTPHLTLKDLKLNNLLSTAYVLHILDTLGFKKSPDVDYSKIVSFLNAVKVAETYEYDFLGSSVSFVISGRENTISSDTIESYTLNSIEDMISKKSIKFLDQDIHYIMDYMVKEMILLRSDSIVFSSGSLNSRTISIQELKQAAQKGVLRQSLLQEFRIKNNGSVRVYKDTENKSVYSLLYNLLLESKQIEYKRKLNEFSQILYYASFIKGLSSSNYNNSGYNNSQFNWGNNEGSNNRREQNLYKLLGVSENAPKADMKKAKIMYLKKNHPDLATSDADKKYRTALVANLNNLWDQYEEAHN